MTTVKKRIYIAAPMFSEADRDYNEKVTKRIEELGFTCYLPQRNEAINDKTKCASSVPIYEGDTEELRKADILVCLLDGATIDPGVAAEIGWVAGWNTMNAKYNLSVPIYGLFTDSRDGTNTPAHSNALLSKMKLLNEEVAESQFPYANLYVVGAIKKYGKIVSSVDSLINILADINKGV